MGSRRARVARTALVASLPAWLGGASAGCTTHQCDPNTVDAGPPDTAVLTLLPSGDYEWETGLQQGPWLPFAAAETLVLHYPVTFADPVPTPACELGADGADAPQENLVTFGVQFANITATGATVINPTCVAYGLRCTVQGFIVATDAGADAGDDAAPE